MSWTPDKYLLLQGILNHKATYTDYTRLNLPTIPNTEFVEFSTASVQNPYNIPLNQIPNYQPVKIYLPVHSNLFFSDNPIPPPPNLSGLGGIAVNPLMPPPKGLFGDDGSVVKQESPRFIFDGLKGTAKNGTSYEMSLSKQVTFLTGSEPYTKVNMIFSEADFKINNDPVLTLGLGYCSAKMFVTLFLRYHNIQSVMVVNLTPVFSSLNNSTSGGYSILTRNILYYNQKLSSQNLNMPATDFIPGMTLATSPLWQFVKTISYFSPALDYVNSQQTVPPLLNQMTPLSSLGSVNHTSSTQTEQQYIDNSMALAIPALAPLAASLADKNIPGLAAAAYMLGWQLIVCGGKDDLKDGFKADYVDFQEWAKQQGPGSSNNPKRWPSMHSDTDGGVAQQAIDELLNNKSGKIK